MSTLDLSRPLPSPTRAVLWRLRALALFGVAWNIFGIAQFLATVTASTDRLVTMGMDAAQAALYLSLPFWMDLAFAIGVFGGLAGSVLLLAGRRLAVPMLAASLVAYLVLYAGDIALGVFAAFGLLQVLILSFVVAVAITLLLTARRAVHRGLVR